MLISAIGLARQGIEACQKRKDLHVAKAAIETFHDALLAVASGRISAEQVKEFFWASGLDNARMLGNLVTYNEPKQRDAGE